LPPRKRPAPPPEVDNPFISTLAQRTGATANIAIQKARLKRLSGEDEDREGYNEELDALDEDQLADKEDYLRTPYRIGSPYTRGYDSQPFSRARLQLKASKKDL